jgi:hypothetical protein
MEAMASAGLDPAARLAVRTCSFPYWCWWDKNYVTEIDWACLLHHIDKIMQAHQIDRWLNALKITWGLRHELLPCTDHVLETEIHRQQCDSAHPILLRLLAFACAFGQ